MVDDLTLLGVGISDRKKLESMGFTTLEQIAVMNRYDLGMGKQKGDTLIQRARNIIANKSMEDIEIYPEKILVYVKSMNEPTKTSILDVLGILYSQEYIDVKLKDNKICIYRKKFSFDGIVDEWRKKEIERKNEESQYYFKTAQEKAKYWINILEAKRKDELAKEGIDIDRKKIIEFARERGFDGFWKNVFEEITGNEIVKKAISVSLFSTYSEPAHLLVLGDPGSSKTLAKDIITQNFKDIQLVGANSTRAGLVCNLGSGTLGVLAYSDRRVVLVDEFDKIPDSDVEYCYELLSNGKCSVHSAKIHHDIESKFIMIAFANPKTKVFSQRPLEDIGLSPILMSRFALVVKTENLEKEERLNLFMKKFYGGGELKKVPEHYDQWIKLARLHQPKINASRSRIQAYLDQADKIYQQHYATQLRRDLRMGDYARRIPMAIARAEFSDVTDAIIEKAEQILIESVKGWE
ncbi:MAG: hypothetical protein QXT63_07830 [Thermoplasmata archaeon]